MTVTLWLSNIAIETTILNRLIITEIIYERAIFRSYVKWPEGVRNPIIKYLAPSMIGILRATDELISYWFIHLFFWETTRKIFGLFWLTSSKTRLFFIQEIKDQWYHLANISVEIWIGARLKGSWLMMDGFWGVATTLASYVHGYWVNLKWVL